jgi:predicted porin
VPRFFRSIGSRAALLAVLVGLVTPPAGAFGPEHRDQTPPEAQGDDEATGPLKEQPGLKRDEAAPEMGDKTPTAEDLQLTETQKMQKIRNEEIFANYATREDLDAVLKSVREWQAYADLIRLYGSFRLGIATQEGGSTTVEDLSPRIGFRGQAKLNDKINVTARVELGVNLVDQDSNEVVIAGDQLGTERFEDDDAVTTRLGYAGLVGDWGSVLIGKQWSVYYDVTQWTDLFWAVGGNASGTYNADTDGGVSGTGRAEKAVTTRFRWRGLRLGGQVQLRSRTDKDKDQADTWGLSAIGDLAFPEKWGAFSYGIAFNKVRDGVDEPGVNEPKQGDESTAAGLLYQSGKWYGALVLNRSKNHEVDDRGRWFDARGAEMFVMYSFMDNWEVHGGLNWLEPDNYRFRDDDGVLQKSEYRRRYLAYGISRRFSRESVLFFEGTIEDSDEADGSSLRNSLIGIGGYYTF